MRGMASSSAGRGTCLESVRNLSRLSDCFSRGQRVDFYSRPEAWRRHFFLPRRNNTRFRFILNTRASDVEWAIWDTKKGCRASRAVGSPGCFIFVNRKYLQFIASYLWGKPWRMLSMCRMYYHYSEWYVNYVNSYHHTCAEFTHT